MLSLPIRNYLFTALMSILLFSASSFASEVKLCNNTDNEARVARYILNEWNFSCITLSSSCTVKVWNWERISSGYCQRYIAGPHFWNYFAVQYKDGDGSWYSPEIPVDSDVLRGNKAPGFTSTSTRMCVRDDTYSSIIDRFVTGMSEGVHNEVCASGYSKVPVNLLVVSEQDLIYTVGLTPLPPPAKKVYPNTYRDAAGKIQPACGYYWDSGFPAEVSGRYDVNLREGFETTPTGVRPAKGYRWVRNDNTSNCEVAPIPVSKKAQPKKRIKKKQ